MSFQIGIDGGGTKTELILVDSSGTIVARHLAPGCNPSIIGAAAARQLVTDALAALTATLNSPSIDRTLLCMAGSRSYWNEFAASLTGYGRVTATDDSLPVLELATDGGPGLVLHAGTGSFVAARGPDGAAHYAGGIGWRFGDPGSAYELGRRAVARTLLELQGWTPSSALGAAVCAKTGLSDAISLTRHFYAVENPNPALAALAPHVTALADEGDRAAGKIIHDSVGELGYLARSVLHKLFPHGHGPTTARKIPIGLGGPILQSAHARRTLDTLFVDRAELRPVTAAPIEGVRRLLLRPTL